MPVCPQQWLSLAPGAAGSRPSVVPRLPSRQPTPASVAHGGRTLLVGRLPPPPALGGTWTEEVQSRTERRTNLHNRRRKKQATPGSGRVPLSLRSRGGYVFGVAGRAAGTQGAAPWSWVCTTPGCPAGDGPSLPAATASRPQPLGRCPGFQFTPWRHRGLGGPGLTRGKQTVTLHLAEVARGVGEWQVQGPRGAGVSDMERKNER